MLLLECERACSQAVCQAELWTLGLNLSVPCPDATGCQHTFPLSEGRCRLLAEDDLH